jgi:uncharacterized membrane protein YkvA (DUF1232 family)
MENQPNDLTENDPKVQNTPEPEASSGAGTDTALVPARTNRFYDRLRNTMARAITRGGRFEKFKDFLLFVPDVFILLCRLAGDSRVGGKEKILLGTGIAYYIFPLDIIPEALTGPIGFLDDLVFGVYILNRLLSDTDEAVLREHWSGDEDLLVMIRKVLGAADGLTSTGFVNQVKRMMK